jgi:hypothetical protein
MTAASRDDDSGRPMGGGTSLPETITLMRDQNKASGTLPVSNPRGIPTTYRGVRFRSRIEARWAAFFDALGWPWSYEPIDLDYYIPDFILTFAAGHVAVEVKADLEKALLQEHAAKIVRSGWEKEFVVVGGRLFDGPSIGVLGERVDGLEFMLDGAVVFHCISCGHTSLRSDGGSWRCRLCGETEGHVGEADAPVIAKLWADAGNRVQWKTAPAVGS